ncbi:GNAT family N-acetyltransferase [Sporanaerobacter sp. PP17-6a]|jgi:GNAT superfamily N-acetyltransferase|uniref:GNAT family N-acetyltransferase n=1 Tax=Sporanaerobacter sp. PP17-6a TaxID=1891289 RepID=UPI00089FADCA|nr:GNAT family N-acetyltransferase [Sporanaerobacter sp. PP17-6a]MBE6082919.1 GNAT family N-acetyltransferase [Tissierellaceae bacterium]SCL82029.1 ribosomal-protein-alanine acetyltransferase [Sporanaerobacter sp. PP17-6a]
MYEIIPICDELRKDVVDFISDNWGSPIIVSKGKVHFADILEGYVAVENGKIDGVITYSIENGECEIVSLDSLVENQGIGSNLINKVIEKAKENKCRRVWLITTNDNTKAIRYYQKRGFYMEEIHINAIQRSRKLKPQIPLYGFDNIPILHEIEFEKII